MNNTKGVKETLHLTEPAVGGMPKADFIIREILMEPGDIFLEI
jgi:hypothetical protein